MTARGHDGTYIKLTEDAIGPARIDATVREAVLEFGLTYHVLDTAVETGWTPGERASGVAVDLYGGRRYTYLELELDTQGRPSANRSVDWVDPLIGARMIWNVTNRCFVLAGGDIGGFGVGSDFAWSALGLLGWRVPVFGLDSAVVGGSRALGQDYSTGSGPPAVPVRHDHARPRARAQHPVLACRELGVDPHTPNLALCTEAADLRPAPPDPPTTGGGRVEAGAGPGGGPAGRRRAAKRGEHVGSTPRRHDRPNQEGTHGLPS